MIKLDDLSTLREHLKAYHEVSSELDRFCKTLIGCTITWDEFGHTQTGTIVSLWGQSSDGATSFRVRRDDTEKIGLVNPHLIQLIERGNP